MALVEASDSSEAQMWLNFDSSTGDVSLVDRGSYAQKKGKPNIQDVMTEAKKDDEKAKILRPRKWHFD